MLDEDLLKNKKIGCQGRWLRVIFLNLKIGNEYCVTQKDNARIYPKSALVYTCYVNVQVFEKYDIYI